MENTLGKERAFKRRNKNEIWRRFCKNKSSIIGMCILGIIVFCAVFADLIAPYDYAEQDLYNTLQPPNGEHWFGTDELGRDILTRIIYGARISLAVGIVAVFIACVIGGLLGAVSGYYGGMLDNVIMRFMDILYSIPSILLNISIIAALGSGVQNMMIAVGLTNIPRYCRLMRGSVLQIRDQEYIKASFASGATDWHLILKHIIPNALSPIIVQATLNVGSAIISCAALSFIGLGIQPPTPEWGAMLSNGRDLLRNHPHITIFPGLAIVTTVLSLNLMGDGLRDALDPKLKR